MGQWNSFDRFGVVHLTELRDGDGVTGRVRRVARRLGLIQDRLDAELFAAAGGAERVARTLMAKWSDRSSSLRDLSKAEERLMLRLSVETARVAPVEVRFVDEVVGHGVFAADPIRARDVIGEYTGVLRAPGPEDFDNHYLAEVPAYGAHRGLLIDGRREGNVTRFINHSHLAPNVSNEFVFHRRRWHRILRADRGIAAGEQILWDYGAEYWRERVGPQAL